MEQEQKGSTHAQSSSSAKAKAPSANTTPAHVPALKTLGGVIERITFQAADTGYTVARLLPDYPSPQASGSSGSSQRGFVRQAKGDDNLVTIIGTLTGVAVGEALELSGYWQQHSQHGWQFKVENYVRPVPSKQMATFKDEGQGKKPKFFA